MRPMNRILMNKLGIRLTGTLTGSASFLGISRTYQKEVDYWILGRAADFVGTPTLYETKVSSQRLIPEKFHLGGGWSRIELSLSFTGKVQAFASGVQLIADEAGTAGPADRA